MILKANVLEYAADSLKEDEEILLAAINNDVDAIKYAPPSIINNEKIMLALIKKAPKYLDEDAFEKYRNDKAFIMKALVENHLVFNYLEKEPQKDEEIRSISGRI